MYINRFMFMSRTEAFQIQTRRIWMSFAKAKLSPEH